MIESKERRSLEKVCYRPVYVPGVYLAVYQPFSQRHQVAAEKLKLDNVRDSKK